MTHAGILVRKAMPSDANRITELYRQLVNDTAIHIEPEQITRMADDERTGLYVGEYFGTVYATALVALCYDAMYRKQPFAVVENVVVDVAVKKCGLGSALFQQIEKFCLEADCSKIMLLSSSQRTDAHQFFERLGFMGSTKRGFVKYRSALKQLYQNSSK